MRAMVDGTVVADAQDEDIVIIEGNRYFPPASVTPGVLVESPTPYTCPWKGESQYYSIRVNGQDHQDLAWAYPRPYPGARERVGTDFAGFVAFDPRVEIEA